MAAGDGNPGAGKTTLALQFLLEGVRAGENCLYVTLSETRGELEAGAETLGSRIVSIAELEKQAILGTIRELKGDKLMAAKLLGIGKTTMYRKLKEYGVSDGFEGDA